MRASSAHELPRTIGRYEIVRLLGTGAMGRVALARDPVLDREVAVKLLRTDIAIPDDVRDGLVVRMRHEARAAARVSHPNLVVLHDMGEDEDAGLFLVFEYVAGPTLKQRIERGPIRTGDVARLARELGQALRFAHDAGVLHRDVKPENVILAVTGSKLVDFGIARVPDSTLTHQGGLLGTPAYSAPETFRSGAFSPASDQFSLAATIYEALFGERAFPGDDAVAVASRIAHDPPERRAARAGLPDAADDVLARGMAKKPEERFVDCEAFGRALDAALRGAPVVATPLPGPVVAAATEDRAMGAPVSVPPPARKPHQVAIGALLVLGAVALVGRGLLRSGDDDATSAEPAAAASDRAAPPPPPPVEPRRPPRPRTAPEARPVDAAPVAPSPSTSSSAATLASSAAPDAGPAPAASADAGATPAAPDDAADAGRHDVPRHDASARPGPSTVPASSSSRSAPPTAPAPRP